MRIHPLCIPKIYKYNPLAETVEIRPANESDVFSRYSDIIEQLKEDGSTFRNTNAFFSTPLSSSTYSTMLKKADWLIILDQSLKSWDISLKAASQKLYYKEEEYRSIGIYSNNNRKFIRGYSDIVNELGNLQPMEEGVDRVIDAIRSLNEDGLLSVVSHSLNRVLDPKHGKGSLGLAIAAIAYKCKHPDALLVGLDTQMAKEWLADREDGMLPDLIAICPSDDKKPEVDIIEVKTYSNSPNSFIINDHSISGHAVEQVSALEDLLHEMFGGVEKITTISRRELLREQVFEALFQENRSAMAKRDICDFLNDLFAGMLKPAIHKNIAFVDFEHSESNNEVYLGVGDYAGERYRLVTIGTEDIQNIISGKNIYIVDTSNPVDKIQMTTEPIETTPCDSLDTRSNSSICNDETSTDDNLQKEIIDKKGNEEGQRLLDYCNRLNKVLRDYNILANPITPDNVLEAARFVRFRVELKPGQTIRSIEKFKSDIGRQMEAGGVLLVGNINNTKYVSIDIPLSGPSKTLLLKDELHLLDSTNGSLDFIAGQTPDGVYQITDLARAPHLLVSGTTGSGKSIFLFSLLVSLMYQYKPDDIEFLIIDPKQTDFVFFDDLPNLYGGKVVLDAEEAIEKLNALDGIEKEERTKRLREAKCKDIESYNLKNPTNKMKRLVVVIDEYADLVTSANNISTNARKEFETTLCRLAQRVRNLGIHLVIATQRPSANIVTGALKINIPFRVSFKLPSHIDSQTILDRSGAEDLLGKGDMIMVTDNDQLRMQGLYISEEDIESFIKSYIEKK